MSDLYAALLAGFVVCLASTLLGARAVRKWIEVYEARREMRAGSPGRMRMIRGWSAIAVWIGVTWFLGSVLGDWGSTGDLDSALERSGARLYVVAELLMAFVESDQ
ncbi:MAG: hypothetical protein QNJ44_11615 [Rhodobacter sp.]|nr:hypothetical protein [Rhodobacter sp.]